MSLSQRYRPLWDRAAAIVAGVLLAHLWSWPGLLRATNTACVAASKLIGLEAVLLSPTTFMLAGMPLRTDTSCTMLDVYLAALPLLWCRERSLSWNAAVALAFFAILMPLNLMRLVAGFWALSRGVSWFWSHEVVAGLVYFGILQALLWWRAASSRAARHASYAEAADTKSHGKAIQDRDRAAQFAPHAAPNSPPTQQP